MRPVKRTTPDDWARANRLYPASASIPGPREPSVTPYFIPFERAFDRVAQIETYGASYDTVVAVSASQMGKTEAILDVIGWTLDQRPAPIMYVGPKDDFVRDEFEPRLKDMLTTSASLASKLTKGQKRQTKRRKTVSGVPVALASAHSTSDLAGMAAKIALMDEVDRIAKSVGGEGNPFSLLEARGYSYPDRIRGGISTPLLGNADIAKDAHSGLELWKVMPAEDIESPIWKLWQSGTQHHFVVPCPECGEFFVPRFKQLRWKGWPEDVPPAVAKRSAYIECPCCGFEIYDKSRRDMNARGEFVAPRQTITPGGVVSGPLPETTILSYWISGLCSHVVSYGERAASYMQAKASGDQNEVQVSVNTGFGELFAPGGGDVPEWMEVAALKRGYKRGTVPPGVRFLTLAVDVQKLKLYYTIKGWGGRATGITIDYGELIGPTTQDEVWNDLAELLTAPIDGYSIIRCFVDSGFRPGKPFSLPVNKVYEFCRRFPRVASPTKGHGHQKKPIIISGIDTKNTGEAAKYGLNIINLDTDYFKCSVHERIRWKPDLPGAWHLPQDTDEDFCKQIVSEARTKTPSGAVKWVPRSRNNHYFDCEAMQAALGHTLRAHKIPVAKDAEPAEVDANDSDETPPAHVPVTTPTPKPPVSEPSAPSAKPALAVKAVPQLNARAARLKRIRARAERYYGAQ